MRQVLQSLSDGKTTLVEVPAPQGDRGSVIIRTTRSLISAGTERMLVEFGRAGWVDKARQQPEKVRQVVAKVGTDGLLSTVDAIRSKLDQPLPLGYCNAGVVIEVGADVHGIGVGDRVASNGAHAEIVAVPRNLCALIPEGVADEAAAFAVSGAIALQGIRLAAPTLGEHFAVTGLGLIGLLAVQILRANGCKVLGIDPDPAKRELAQRFGAEVVAIERGEDPVEVARSLTRGQGLDGVVITAATRSNEPVSQGAKMCRKRGRIVLVGVAGLELDRSDFYEKELSFQVSCSYGPGRYDPQYEQQGQDYPLGFVRWTEQRNIQAVLDLLASGRLDVAPLISHRFALEAAAAAYELLAGAAEPYLGIVLEYPSTSTAGLPVRTVELHATPAVSMAARANTSPRVAFIGAGNYAGRTLIPAFVAAGAVMSGIASGAGVTAAHYGRKYGFERATTDARSLTADPDVNVVVVATRHNSHGRFVLEALSAGKNVFVEKPLAIRRTELDAIESVLHAGTATGAAPQLMVGFNRRFAPHTVAMKRLLDGVREPKSFIVTVNAGAIPGTHWTQDPEVGGGRIVGEGCHFIDMLRFLVGHSITEARIEPLGKAVGHTREDVATITLAFADGSVGTIHYFANGSVRFPKERIEAFCGGRILQIDNFRRLRGFGWPGFKPLRLWRQDKGQLACVKTFLDAVRNARPAPIALGELLEVSRVTLALGEAARP